jgi:phage baseplate assembly protein W
MSDYTVKWPLEFTSESSGFESINEDQLKSLVEFNLKNIILTEKGERLFFPDFGVGIRKYLFEQSTSIGFEALRGEMTSQIKRYAPYVIVEDLQFNTFDNTMQIRLAYSVKKIDVSDILVLDIEI